MSYNYSNYPSKKKKVSFNPELPPPDNRIPSGLIKSNQMTGAEDYIYEYKKKDDDTCFWIKKSTERGKKEFTPMSYDKDKKTCVP